MSIAAHVSNYLKKALLNNTLTDAFKLPAGTTAQRPSTVANGQVRYNSTTSKFEGYQGGSWVNLVLAGTASQITIASNAILIADNPVLPGTGSVTLPSGNTAARPGTPTNGMIRYNSQTHAIEAIVNGAWVTVTVS